MFTRLATATVVVFVALLLAGCAAQTAATGLAVSLGQPVRYTSAEGHNFVARYGSLSDGSLHFVKLEMPDGREYTLPQVLSGSGVRYTDEREIVWWEHQGTIRVDVRDEDGQWITKYSALQEVSERN
jgi:membrane-bound inhibitor of C-type lysozyme